MVAQAIGEDAGTGTRIAAASRWKFLHGQEGLARLAEATDSRARPRAADGISDISCLKAAAWAASASQSTIFVAEYRGHGGDVLLPFRSYCQMRVCHVVPLTAPLSQYAPDPVRPLRVDAIGGLLQLLREDKGADLLLMRRVREDNPLSTGLEACGAHPAVHCHAPYIDLAAFANYQAYLKSFSRKSRRSRERGTAKLKREFGSIGFSVIPGARAGAALITALAWKRAWLREQGVTSVVFDGGPWEAAFLECAAAPNAFLSVLDVAGRPVAVELGFVTDRDYASYFGAYDPAFGCYRVGQEQISRTVGWCFERGIERFDLLAPWDAYKRHWTRSSTAVAVADYAVPLSTTGSFAAFAHCRLRPLAKRVRDAMPRRLRRGLAAA